MLRKDVKLGFAIGGVMLAVVVVYVLVVPNNDRNKTNLVTEDGVSSNVNSGNPSATPDALAKNETKTEQPALDNKALNKPVDSSVADRTKPDNVGDNSIAVGGPTAVSPPAQTKGDIWDLALRDGVVPPSMSTTPTKINSDQPADKTQSSAPDKTSDKGSSATDDKVATDSTNSTKTTAMMFDKGVTDTPSSAIVDTAGDATVASDKQSAGQTSAKSADTTHVVKAGETLSSIAAASYGDSKAWKLISQANPDVNPNRLSAGTHLVIPAKPTATADHAADHGGAANGGALDPATRYQVQANDSLYRISMKLYGKADHVTKLYEDNKDVIGADPRHLKLGMVLKLTDKPATSVSSAAR